MKNQFISKLVIGILLLFPSFQLQAAELLLGLKNAVPKARTLLRYVHTVPNEGEVLRAGLNKAVPVAKTILNNCVTTLPQEYKYLEERFKRIGSTVLQTNEWVEEKTPERQADFMRTFYGSSVSRTISSELDEINVAVNRDPGIEKLPAYKNAKEIAVNLGLEPILG